MYNELSAVNAMGVKMRKSFNLQRYMKKAFYEGVRGYWCNNSRAWPNCLKEKMDGVGKSKQEAYAECMYEYNTWDKGKWATTYVPVRRDSANPRVDHNTPGSKDSLIKPVKQGPQQAGR